MKKGESKLAKLFKYYVLIIFLAMLPSIINDVRLGWTLFLLAILAPPIFWKFYSWRKKQIFFQNLNTLEKIRKLTPRQFEEFVCELFRQLGYIARAQGKPSDGGIDIVIKKNGEKHYVQCKRYIGSQVSVGAMRDFYGALMDKLNDTKAFFITTNIFTLQAEIFARGKSIELVDGKQLMKYVRLAGMLAKIPKRARLMPRECPQCGARMILRTAHSGMHAGKRFYGCLNFPNCRFIREINR